MSVEDRRDSIVSAALPLFLERGADVTTREIADAAGIAEGTIFRAFEDKQQIIDTVIARAMDPEPTYAQLRALGPELSLEDTVTQVITILRERFDSVVSLMSVLGRHGTHHRDHHKRRRDDVALQVTEELLERHRGSMRLDPPAAAHAIRVLAMGVSMPLLGSTSHLTTRDIVDLVLHGIVKKEA